MVRAFIKGGVWKNSEDEILKAAVQKYGKQQWARCASLLNRKTAKQCKARWFEWLDPSVRKLEWSREEEEKLLHLAKLMPAQWKTVGPLVGRTATQCQEHYEKLLDEAAAKSSGEDGTTDGIRHQPLRVGQIDSHPETKPARPDPIDMDEDEIEMLQEARARLANTQGKKAKRKSRERMLAQAKRMADLQKRRELKQAGLISGKAKKKSRRRLKGGDIDLGVEIPFHKPAPAGFHDISGEVARSEALRNKQIKRVDFHELNEQQYRSRDEEQKKSKKREEARLRALEKSNMNYVVAQVSEKNDPLNIRKRAPLTLPAPSVSDQELQTLAKIEESARRPIVTQSANNDATSALLADYSDRPLPTPMRTPATAPGNSLSGHGESKQQSIMREASNLRMLERGQTPLLGGENPLIEERPGDEGEGSNREVTVTRPTTPGGPFSEGTVTRDQFGLNQRPPSEFRYGYGDDTASVGASTFATSTNTAGIRDLARAERRAAKRARLELEQALAALPAPQFEYELETPAEMDVDENDGMSGKKIEEDMADVEAEERRKVQAEANKLYEARSSVLKRNDLPRPSSVILADRQLVDNSNDKTTNESVAEELIDKERFTLLKYDAFVFPVQTQIAVVGNGVGDKKGKKRKKKRKFDKNAGTESAQTETVLEPMSEKALDHARELIRLEYDRSMNEKIQPLLKKGNKLEAAADILCCETLNYTRSSPSANEIFFETWKHPRDNDQYIVQCLTQEFETLLEATSVLHRKNEKIESKLTLLTGGFAKRAQNAATKISQCYHDLQNTVIEKVVYQTLKEKEELGAVARIDQLRTDICNLKNDEDRLVAVLGSLKAPHD